ncbi:MAG: IS630 family transposase [Planctomycetota bacterium]|nr:IS630 family transposase [Planctomycetota bacterium]
MKLARTKYGISSPILFMRNNTDLPGFSPVKVDILFIISGGYGMPKRLVLTHPLASTALASLVERRKDARVECRIIALRQVALGHKAEEAAEAVGVSERTIREWVASLNREDVDSLRYDRHKGRIPHWTPDQEVELAEAIRKDPPPEMKIEVWRGWTLQQWVKEQFGVEYCGSGIYRLLHRLGFSSLMPRPVHPDSDPVVQEEFKKRRCRSSSAS